MLGEHQANTVLGQSGLRVGACWLSPSIMASVPYGNNHPIPGGEGGYHQVSFFCAFASFVGLLSRRVLGKQLTREMMLPENLDFLVITSSCMMTLIIRHHDGDFKS